jgi:hypothetical protein
MISRIIGYWIDPLAHTFIVLPLLALRADWWVVGLLGAWFLLVREAAQKNQANILDGIQFWNYSLHKNLEWTVAPIILAATQYGLTAWAIY